MASLVDFVVIYRLSCAIFSRDMSSNLLFFLYNCCFNYNNNLYLSFTTEHNNKGNLASKDSEVYYRRPWIELDVEVTLKNTIVENANALEKTFALVVGTKLFCIGTLLTFTFVS